MQLRTVKKPKSKAFDFGRDKPSEQPSGRKTSFNNEQGEKEVVNSSGENSHSNLTQENESKSRHKLRNTSNNYQGKYKKMNSGKYLYKINNSDKKPVINKRKQLKVIPFELVNTFKRLLNKLNKKEEESLLNKKKKREESKEQGSIKQKTGESIDYKKKMNNKMKDVNQFHQMNNLGGFDYHQYMMKPPYDMYYNPAMMENLKNQGYPVDSQMYYRFNKDFMRLLAPPDFYYRQGYPPQFEQEPKNKNESIFNLINDKENLNRINKIANEGVNHIVAAFFIKSVQQSRQPKNTPEISSQQRRSSVPINSVNLGEEKEQSYVCNENININEIHPSSNSQNPVHPSSPQSSSVQNGNTSPRHKSIDPGANPQVSKYTLSNISLNAGIFNDKSSTDLHEITDNQLNTVNNVLKKLNENKRSEIIDKDHSNMTLNLTSNFQNKK